MNLSDDDKTKLKIVYFIKQLFLNNPEIKMIDIILTHYEKTDVKNNALEQSVFLEQLFFIDLEKYSEELSITPNASINSTRLVDIFNKETSLFEEKKLINWQTINNWQNQNKNINRSNFKLKDINNIEYNYDMFYNKYIKNSFINNKEFFLEWTKMNNNCYYNTTTKLSFVNNDNSYFENFLGQELIAHCEKMFLTEQKNKSNNLSKKLIN